MLSNIENFIQKYDDGIILCATLILVAIGVARLLFMNHSTRIPDDKVDE